MFKIKQLNNVKKFEKVRLSGKKIFLSRKLKLYIAQVVSVILYNANSWAARSE